MEHDVLTTTQAAKLLGISVRTAQLLVEGGSLTSWKTPGGHRRVYRADVMALMKRPHQAAAISSAVVVVLASPDRLPLYKRILSGVSEWSVDLHSSAYSASYAIGSRLPAAVVVDLADDDAEQRSFLRNLAATAALGHAHLVVVGGAGDAPTANARPTRWQSLRPNCCRALSPPSSSVPRCPLRSRPCRTFRSRRMKASG